MELKHLNSLLTFIEKKESRLLNWGITNFHHSESEVLEIIDDWIEKTDLSDYLPETYLENLIDKKLIVQINNEKKYRTRMAETMFYMSSLKQILPRHFDDHGYDAWRYGRNLVYDFRFSIRDRYFPFEKVSFVDYSKQLTTEEDQKFLEAILKINENSYFDLFPFQVRSAESVLNALSGKSAKRATIVTAGTGAGKTLSYYLPALFSILKKTDTEYFTKSIAFYPRNSLLIDQYQSAAEFVTKINSQYRKLGLTRKIRIGHLFGQTPSLFGNDINEQIKELKNRYGWGIDGDGNPEYKILKCTEINENTNKTCNGTLVWEKKDIQNKNERLLCKTCLDYTDPKVFPVTRQSILETPPDLLFLSMETLNQRLSDRNFHRLFGIGVAESQRVETVLLDEIHTYSGLYGLNAKYVLNRWKNLAFKKEYSGLHFVGLSATLSNPVQLMASICNLDEEEVDHVEPYYDEMSEESGEYTVILRSDPTSQVAVLSTTIQTLLLLPRLLDKQSKQSRQSQGVFGTKTWVFTDDLDVTNRLYDFIQDADNEKELYTYRDKNNVSDLGYEYGQRWDFAEELNYELESGNSLRISRTSGQDKGLDKTSDLVIATESLTVGVSDSEVGAVVQHKAPRSLSTYVQRKGRAGRTRIMRPWNIVVLSDYGIDKTLYQSWDTLLEPKIQSNSLPKDNKYILKIQATLTLLDFLSTKLNLDKNLFYHLSIPNDENKVLFGKVVEVLDQIINNEILEEFKTFVMDALNVGEKQLESILFDPPRSILGSVVPTMIRRLENNFKNLHGKDDLYILNKFLPDFVTTPLFSELTLPEISFEDQTNFLDESLSFQRGLKEFSPGRVSRYFNIGQNQRRWVPVDLDSEKIDVSNFIKDYIDISSGDKKIIQPTKFELASPSPTILDSSNSKYLWDFEIKKRGTGQELDIGNNSFFNEYIDSVRFFTHSTNSPLKILRYSNTVEGQVNIRDNDSTYFVKQLYLNEEEVGIGSEGTFDGIEVIVDIKELYKKLTKKLELKDFRNAYFHHLIENGSSKFSEIIPNVFLRQRLGELIQRGLITKTLVEGTTIKNAHQIIFEDTQYLKEVTNSVFGGLSDMDADNQTPLVEQILPILDSSEAIDELKDLSSIFFTDLKQNQEFVKYIKDRIVTTLSGSIYNSINFITDNSEEINVDIKEEEKNKIKIYFSESSIGGVGTIDNLLQTVINQPNIFLNLIINNLEISDLEKLNNDLTHLVSNLNQDINLKDYIKDVRTGNISVNNTENIEKIKSIISNLGLVPSDSLISSFLLRFGRQGTTSDFDEIILELIDDKIKMEKELGIEIDRSDLSYYAISKFTPEVILKSLNIDSVSNDVDSRMAISLIESTLWVGGWRLRSNSLFYYSRFSRNYTLPDRFLFKELLDSHEAAKIEINSIEELEGERIENEFFKTESNFIVKVVDKSLLKTTIINFINKPIEVGYLEIFPNLKNVKYLEDSKYKVVFELPEVVS